MALLRDRGVAAELDIVGGGEEAGALQTQVRALGLGDRVRFRGWLSADETRRAMAGTTLLVHAPLEQDAMPTVLKEALALGTPVVASDSAGIPEILAGGRCGALVPPGNPVALAAALEILLADPARRRAYADAGRRQAERLFDLATNGRAFAERLRSTIRPSHPPLAREVRSA
jgi:glycosyltransferase involved in cell wall biosynthesis